MKITYRNNKFYIIDAPKDAVIKKPLRSHRFKNGSGTCSFDPSQFYDFVNTKNHLLLVDMTLKKVLQFSKEDVLLTVTKKPFMGGFIFVAELMPLYLNNKYIVIGDANG